MMEVTYPMKRLLTMFFIAMMVLLFVACNPESMATYTITIDYNLDGVEDKVLTEQSTLEKPADPEGDDAHEFAYWTINNAEVADNQWGTALSNDVTLTAVWINVYMSLADVPELPDSINVSDGYSYDVNTEIDFDGKNLVKIRNWQDINTSANLTIKGVIFEHGLSIHATNPADTSIAITVEGCEIHPCDQLAWKNGDETKPIRTSNSGDGLCLGIDTSFSSNPSADENQDRGDVSVRVFDNKLIGDNNPNAERDGWKALEGNDQARRARGNGVSIGNQSGGTVCLAQATIEGNYFEGLRGHAIQLYSIREDSSVTIKDNQFISWGINKNTLAGEKDDYAIRGDLAADNPGTVSLDNNSYGGSVTAGGITRDLSNYKVAIDRWNQNPDNSYDQSQAK